MTPTEAVNAHMDLNPQLSIAAHFQVFQLGADGFDDAVNGLASVLKERHLPPDAFIAPVLGRAVMVTPMNQLIKDIAAVGGPLRFETSSW